MGDFYEMFYDDAKTAARVLGLALTSRDKGENPVPMAGFPYHQLESYLGKLIAAGLRVAICDQVEDPKQAKGLVRREVTRIVTAGTVTDDALLDPRTSNYLAAVVPAGAGAGLAWVELSTGRFHAACFPAAQIADELARIDPAECLISEETGLPADTLGADRMLTRRAAWTFGADTAREVLLKHFGTASLEGFGFDDADGPAIRAAGAVLGYLVETQKASLGHIDRLVRYSAGTALEIDEATRRSLEITRTLREGRREGSLLGVMDRTVTAMGSRLLADWLANPLTDVERIDERLDAVAELVSDAALAGTLQDQLRGIYDLERLLARVTTGRASPRDLSFVGRTLGSLPQIKAKITARRAACSSELEERARSVPRGSRAGLEKALADDCPLVSREGGFIRDGFSSELDALRELTSGGKQWIAQLPGRGDRALRHRQPEGRLQQGVRLLPRNHQRPQREDSQALHPQADGQERRALHHAGAEGVRRKGALGRRKGARAGIYAVRRVARNGCRLRGAVATHRRRAGRARRAGVAGRAGPTSRTTAGPTMVAEPVLQIIDGRHPVLDAIIAEGSFVPNDASCGGEDGFSLLITGPEHGRQEHVHPPGGADHADGPDGQLSCRPARRTIGVADRIFARVGASDELSRGQSTFMVEMTETARILNTATPRSLVILDEIGRGTSTYDGLSLAWAVVEYLHDRVGCRTLFATHYHELTDLAGSLTGLRNLNVAVREWQDEVVFLHKIVPGAADKSYGIHVARLAGVPPQVVERAKQILAQLEKHLLQGGKGNFLVGARKKKTPDLQFTLFAAEEHPLVGEVRALELDTTTPLAALGWLRQWQDRLGRGQGTGDREQ